MKVLVTGGTGFIGSHTVVALQQKGYEVVIVDNLSNSKREVAGRIAEITGVKPLLEVFDLCNEELTRDFFIRHPEINAVLHFAALKSVGESVKKPLHYYRNNIVSSMNLLQCMQEFNVPFLVFSSSCTVYGQPDVLPVTERSPLKQAESPYGNTKKIMEDIIRDVTRVSGVKAILLRYFNPVGAHDSVLIGEDPNGIPENLVPFITQTAIGRRGSLSVYGNDYNTPDGTPIRDYIHVVDLAAAHVKALNRLESGLNKSDCEVFNLGTGKGNTVMEVIRAFEKVSGTKLNYRITDRRPGDVEKVWADTSLANSELGWKADRTLEEMMLSAWKWELANAARKSSE